MNGALNQDSKSTPREGGLAFMRSRPAYPLGAPNANLPENNSQRLTEEQSNGEKKPQEIEVPPAEFLPSLQSFVVDSEVLQPGEYHPSYCQKMLEYFDRDKTRVVYDTFTWKSGATTEKERYLPNTPPHFSEFARSIGVSTKKLKVWYSKYPEFAEAYDICQEILEEFLIDNGLTGGYGAVAMKFVAVNRSNMKDKVVQETQTIDINKVLDQIAQGKLRPGGEVVE